MDGMSIFQLIIFILFAIWGYIAYKDGISADHFTSLVLLMILVLMYKFTNKVIKQG